MLIGGAESCRLAIHLLKRKPHEPRLEVSLARGSARRIGIIGRAALGDAPGRRLRTIFLGRRRRPYPWGEDELVL